MASAALVNPVRVQGGTAYEVEAWPFEASPFGGPATRDWAAFELVGAGEARFEWRTRADRIQAAISALEVGVSPASVLVDAVVARYVIRIAASVQEMPPAALEDLAAAILPGLCWSDLVEPAGLWTAYRTDEDVFLDEAAAALDLPRWARVTRSTAATAPGARQQTLVVVQDGHSLADLARWFASGAADRQRPT